ncbi:MAG: hypothetical protein LW892_08600, partial [Betaproteobacteria bacterium]|nr:hypothetical protein [Betaproteobacteria bacterium]
MRAVIQTIPFQQLSRGEVILNPGQELLDYGNKVRDTSLGVSRKCPCQRLALSGCTSLMPLML